MYIAKRGIVVITNTSRDLAVSGTILTKRRNKRAKWSWIAHLSFVYMYIAKRGIVVIINTSRDLAVSGTILTKTRMMKQEGQVVLDRSPEFYSHVYR